MALPRRPHIELDEDFMACTLDDIKENIEALAKSRAKKPLDRVTQIWSPYGRITITVSRAPVVAS